MRIYVAANEQYIEFPDDADIRFTGSCSILFSARRTSTWASGGPEPAICHDLASGPNVVWRFQNGGIEDRINVQVRTGVSTWEETQSLPTTAFPADTDVDVLFRYNGTTGDYELETRDSSQTLIESKTGTIGSGGFDYTDVATINLGRLPSGSSAWAYAGDEYLGELMMWTSYLSNADAVEAMTRTDIHTEAGLVFDARISPDGGAGDDPEPETVQGLSGSVNGTTDPAATGHPSWKPDGGASEQELPLETGVVTPVGGDLDALGNVTLETGVATPVGDDVALVGGLTLETGSVALVGNDLEVGAGLDLETGAAAPSGNDVTVLGNLVLQTKDVGPVGGDVGLIGGLSLQTGVVTPAGNDLTVLNAFDLETGVVAPAGNDVALIGNVVLTASGSVPVEGQDLTVTLASDPSTPPWSDPTQSVGSIIIHVSNAGNDTTGDGSIGNPYATWSRANSDVVAGRSDWVLLRFGDTFSGPITVTKNGASAAQPMMIGAYGNPGDGLPIINHTVGSNAINNSGARHNILIRDLDVYPTGWTPSTTPSGSSSGIALLGSICTNWTIEGCRFRGFGNGFTVSIGGSGAPYFTGIVFRGCQFDENGNHSFSNRTQGLVVEYCNVGFCYSGVVGSPHAFYDNENNVDSDYRYNTYSEVPGAGTNEVRGVNCTFRDSYFVGCNDGIYAGTLTTSIKTHCNVLRNVFDSSTSVRSTMVYQNRGTTGTTTIRYNLGINGPSGLSLIDLRVQPSGGGCDDVDLIGNVVAGGHSILLSLGGSGDHSNLVFHQNRPHCTGAIVTEADGLAGSEFDSADNVLFSNATGTSRFTWNGTGMDFAAFATAVGDSGSVFANPSFTDPTRDGASYVDFIESTTGSTNADLIAKLFLQNRVNWNPDYSAPAINSWIQTGFDMPELSGEVPSVGATGTVTLATARAHGTAPAVQRGAVAGPVTEAFARAHGTAPAALRGAISGVVVIAFARAHGTAPTVGASGIYGVLTIATARAHGTAPSTQSGAVVGSVAEAFARAHGTAPTVGGGVIGSVNIVVARAHGTAPVVLVGGITGVVAEAFARAHGAVPTTVRGAVVGVVQEAYARAHGTPPFAPGGHGAPGPSVRLRISIPTITVDIQPGWAAALEAVTPSPGGPI